MKNSKEFIVKSLVIALGLASTFALSSCGNVDEPVITDENLSSSSEMSGVTLEKVLCNVVETSDRSEDSFIVYDASTDTYLCMTASEYELANAFADLVTQDESVLTRVPPGQGWIVGGTGKSKFDAMRIANGLLKKIPANKDFEIRVEYNANGSYTVYYRLV